MSAVQWAKTVRCDWPGCQSEGEVTIGKVWPQREVPPGWTDAGVDLRIESLGANRQQIRELCSIHSVATIAQLAEAFAFAPKEPTP